MKKKILIGSIIAVVILTLVSFSSVVGYNSVKSNPDNTIITDEWDFEYCKDYLFETIIEIADNEDIKDLINSNNQNLFSTNSNHRTFFPLRKNTNELSVEKLDFIYKMGLRLIDRLGEDKVAELKESISIDKPDFVDELDAIIMNNDELMERIYTLNEMNVKSESLDWNYPIICFMIQIYFIFYFIIGQFANDIFEYLYIIGFTTLSYIIPLIFFPFMVTAVISLGISVLLCYYWYPYYPYLKNK